MVMVKINLLCLLYSGDVDKRSTPNSVFLHGDSIISWLERENSM